VLDKFVLSTVLDAADLLGGVLVSVVLAAECLSCCGNRREKKEEFTL